MSTLAQRLMQKIRGTYNAKTIFDICRLFRVRLCILVCM